MDKAAGTLTWQCPHARCCRLREDLLGDDSHARWSCTVMQDDHAVMHAVMTLCTEPIQQNMSRRAAFITGQGFPAGAILEAIPCYVGNPKMHKSPLDMRFISSSESSSAKTISVCTHR